MGNLFLVLKLIDALLNVIIKAMHFLDLLKPWL